MVQTVSLLLPDVLEDAPDEHDLPHLGKLEPEVGCPRNKQKKFRSEPKQDLFWLCFGLFRETNNKKFRFVSVFRTYIETTETNRTVS
jgi:hypothetical protein